MKRLLDRKSFLLEKNVYGETFTERQFNLVFDPLLSSGYDRAQILKALGREEMIPFRDLQRSSPWTRPGRSIT